MKKTVVTIGGGIAGVEASSLLVEMGYDVVLIEKENQIGGKMNRWDRLFPNQENAKNIREYLDARCKKTGLKPFTNTEINQIKQTRSEFYIQTNTKYAFKADAILVATGFEPFNAARKEEYGYKIYDHVTTSVDLERMLRQGNPIVTSEGERPKRVGMVHCVGSRDEKVGNHYCSKVCCVTAIKQAIELREQIPDAEIFCFYMDLRMFGRGFEELYRRAQEKYHIQFVRGRMSEVSENADHSLQIKAEDTLTGRPLRMNIDMLVLMVGMEAGKGTTNACKVIGLEQRSDSFIDINDPFCGHNETYNKGIFVAGCCAGPMSVSETLDNARSAALQIHQYLQGKTKNR